jgi:Na+-transporting methylmalonyl-CoA/oxaloacetate decarboxylase gamma subunit
MSSYPPDPNELLRLLLQQQQQQQAQQQVPPPNSQGAPANQANTNMLEGLVAQYLRAGQGAAGAAGSTLPQNSAVNRSSLPQVALNHTSNPAANPNQSAPQQQQQQKLLALQGLLSTLNQSLAEATQQAVPAQSTTAFSISQPQQYQGLLQQLQQQQPTTQAQVRMRAFYFRLSIFIIMLLFAVLTCISHVIFIFFDKAVPAPTTQGLFPQPQQNTQIQVRINNVIYCIVFEIFLLKHSGSIKLM